MFTMHDYRLGRIQQEESAAVRLALAEQAVAAELREAEQWRPRITVPPHTEVILNLKGTALFSRY